MARHQLIHVLAEMLAQEHPLQAIPITVYVQHLLHIKLTAALHVLLALEPALTEDLPGVLVA